MAAINFGWVGPQDPIYGLHHHNIATRLTRLNWRTKALIRCSREGWLYLWVARGTYRNHAGKVSAYFVKANTGSQKNSGDLYEQEFHYLMDAMAYVNGEDGGRLANETWPARPVEYPCELDTPYYIGFTLSGSRSR